MTMNRVMTLAAGVALLAGCGGGGGRTAPLRRISMNAEVSGMLRSNDPRLNDNSVYHLYTFRGSAGQNIQIDVMASDFDAFAILQDASGRELARDDDGGDGLNARISYVLPSNGMYRIVANTYRQNAFGSYRLRLSSLGTGTPTVSGTRTITRGERIGGRLTLSDPRLADNSVYHAYTYVARAGETITVDVMSSDFDAYTLIQDVAGTRLESDDDSGEGLNAMLTYTFPYAGTFRIIVNTFSAGGSGAYTLWVH